jgi:ferredoxin-type protein NapH
MKRQNIRKLITLITFLLFPVIMNFLSPYLIIDGAMNGIIVGSFIMFAILFISSLVLGRAFCGWVCPVAALQESCFGINNKKVQGKLVNKIKYFIWVPWIITIVIALFFSGGIQKINFLYLTETGISVDAPLKYITYYFVVGLFLVLAIVLGKRGACHSICWMAPFMIIGVKLRRLLRLPALHLKAENDKCNGCKACDAKCPMSLEVNSMVKKGSMSDDECILCGECVDICSKKVIKYTFFEK